MWINQCGKRTLVFVSNQCFLSSLVSWFQPLLVLVLTSVYLLSSVVCDVSGTMGTTKAIAGSAAAFRRVDYDYVTQSAQLMKDNGVKCYLQCSSQGASATSWLLYPKTKGQAEEACKIMKFAHCAIFRPAVLITPREQKRPMEGFFQAICPDAFSIKSTHLVGVFV